MSAPHQPLSLAARLARVIALRGVIDAHGGGQMLFYEAIGADVLPPTPETVITAAPLATLPLDTPPSGSVDVAGEAPALLALLSLTPVSGLASAQGLVGFARIADGAGVGIVDLRAGPQGSELPVILSALQLYMGGEVKLLSCLISE